MGKIESVLREEVLRLAKKAAREQQSKLNEDVRKLKSRVSSLQNELQRFKNQRAKEQSKQRMARATRETQGEETPQIRMSPTLIKKLRKRLNISQPQLAALLDVSNAAVGFWESGKSQPRPAMKTKIAALRKLGRRDVQRLLEEKGMTRKTRKRVPRTKKEAEASSEKQAS